MRRSHSTQTQSTTSHCRLTSPTVEWLFRDAQSCKQTFLWIATVPYFHCQSKMNRSNCLRAQYRVCGGNSFYELLQFLISIVNPKWTDPVVSVHNTGCVVGTLLHNTGCVVGTLLHNTGCVVGTLLHNNSSFLGQIWCLVWLTCTS